MARPAFKLEWVTPQRVHVEKEVVAVRAPGHEGQLSILARHQPLVCLLREGVVEVQPAQGYTELWRVAAGTLIVRRAGVTIVTRSATLEPRPHAPADPPESRSPSP